MKKKPAKFNKGGKVKCYAEGGAVGNVAALMLKGKLGKKKRTSKRKS